MLLRKILVILYNAVEKEMKNRGPLGNEREREKKIIKGQAQSCSGAVATPVIRNSLITCSIRLPSR